MNIIEALQWRYAVKKFNDKEIVSKKKLEILYKAFNLTATSYGLQPIKLLVISNKELQKNLVKHSMAQEQIAQASHVLVFCIETKINEDYIKSYFNRIRKTRKTPEEILKPFETFLINDFESKPLSEIKQWAIKQAYLAMGNLLTVCATEGIDSCPMEGFSPKAYDEVLKLKEQNLASVLVMPIGYRAEDDYMSKLKKVRKEISNTIVEL